MSAKPNDRQISNPQVTPGTPAPVAAIRPLQVLVQRRWQLLSCLLLVCGVAFAATAWRKPKYEAAARVQVVMDQPRLGPKTSPAAGLDYFSTQCQLLKSRRVLARAAEKLQGTGGNWPYSEAGIKQLRKSVNVEPVPGSRLIDITSVADTGSQAAAIANHITAAFIETSTEARLAANARIIARVKEQIAAYEKEVSTQEAKIGQFQQEHLITGAVTVVKAMEDRITQLEKCLTETQMNRLALETRRNKLQNILTSGNGLTDNQTWPQEIYTDPTIASLQQTINQCQQEEAQLSQAYLPGHEKLRTIRIRIADLQAKLLQQRRILLQALHEETMQTYAATVREEEALRGLLNQQKESGVQLNEQNQQYQQMLTELETTRRFKSECIRRMREFTLSEGMSESPVMVVDAARIPNKPAGLSKSHQAASILLLGLLFSIGFILALDRLTTVSEVPATAVPTGYIPVAGQPIAYWPNEAWSGAIQTNYAHNASAQTATPAPDTPSTTLARIGTMEIGRDSDTDAAFAARCQNVCTDSSSNESAAFREINSHLLGRFGLSRQSVVVTGLTHQSGKTTFACNLALTLAQAGRKVLLVDAHTEAPALKENISAQADQPGLQDAIQDISVLEIALQNTDIANLTVLHHSSGAAAAGPYDINNISILHSELRNRYDWIIYDAGIVPELLTQAFLQTTGKSLCVVDANENTPDSILIEQLEKAGAVNLGIIVNHPAIRKKVERTFNNYGSQASKVES